MGTADAATPSPDAARRSLSPPASDARHRQAVANTLRWADEAAERGDPADALMWVGVIRAIGDELPAAYERKCTQWKLALSQAQATAPALTERPAGPKTARRPPQPNGRGLGPTGRF